MNIALLNVRIVIQKNTVTVDKIGNHQTTWKDYFSCYATISNEASNVEKAEDFAAGTLVDNSRADFTIRWCKEIDEVTADDFRVVYLNEIYNILGIDHMNFKRKSIKLKCQKARR